MPTDPAVRAAERITQEPHTYMGKLPGEVAAIIREECPTIAEVERLREALEKLSRLGNEPHLGNSDGNMIARDALAATEKPDG